MTARLSTVAPDLVKDLRGQSAGILRDVARATAAWVTERLGLSDPRLDAGLAALSQNVTGPSVDRNAVEQLVEQLDEQAWDIQDQMEDGAATEADYAAAFCRARAASTVYSALDSDPLQAVLDTLYEAHAATEDLESLRSIVRSTTKQ